MLEFDPAHPRHAHVKHQAPWREGTVLLEKLKRARVREHVPAFALDHELPGAPDVGIVVHYADNRLGLRVCGHR
mgnify:CR=1 FL=1